MISLISAQKVSKSFGGKSLFREISLVVGDDERCALIGNNGAGKSTLLKILAGLQDPDDGQVTRQKGLHIGMVAQIDQFPEDRSVYEVVNQAVPEHLPDRSGSIARALGEAEFHDDSIKVHTLSGGWRKRLAIARELAKSPDVLFLDEPTNHLDIDGILWLEGVLKSARFPVMFISHDRYFIENLATRVVELGEQYPGGYFSAEGSYSEFLSNRAEFLAQRKQMQATLANKVRREIAWLRQGAKARTTKSKHRSEEAYKLVDELRALPPERQPLGLEFASTSRKSKELLKLENIAKRIGDRTLFKKVSLVISPGVRLGIVGANGTGKSTLLKTLLGQEAVDQGQIVRASRLSLAYFDQARATLDKEQSLQKALCREGNSVVFGGREIHVSSWANRFLFRTDQLQMSVKQLSGGEQARLMLARIMLEPADILILDEPTNDLDIPALEVLEESLDEFPGAIVVVTHDRYLLDRVATQVLGLLGNGETALCASYTQWEIVRQELLAAQTGAQAQNKAAKEKALALASASVQKKLTPAQQKEWDGIENAILKAEAKVKQHEQELSALDSKNEAEKFRTLCQTLAAAQKKVDELYTRWEELSELKRSFGQK